MNFLSLTHYRQPRNILYSGTLYEVVSYIIIQIILYKTGTHNILFIMLFMELLEQHGKPRFVVLLTDMLLILKPKKKMKMNMVQSKLGAQMPQLDWFSDLGCKAKRVSTTQTLVPCIPSSQG